MGRQVRVQVRVRVGHALQLQLRLDLGGGGRDTASVPSPRRGAHSPHPPQATLPTSTLPGSPADEKTNL